MPVPHLGTPMRLARLRAPFDDRDGLFEIKHDGYRALAHVEDGFCRLVSRNGNTFTRWPALCHVASSGSGAASRLCARGTDTTDCRVSPRRRV
jgi:ATP-dependent DNA ligase